MRFLSLFPFLPFAGIGSKTLRVNEKIDCADGEPLKRELCSSACNPLSGNNVSRTSRGGDFRTNANGTNNTRLNLWAHAKSVARRVPSPRFVSLQKRQVVCIAYTVAVWNAYLTRLNGDNKNVFMVLGSRIQRNARDTDIYLREERRETVRSEQRRLFCKHFSQLWRVYIQTYRAVVLWYFFRTGLKENIREHLSMKGEFKTVHSPEISFSSCPGITIDVSPRANRSFALVGALLT